MFACWRTAVTCDTITSCLLCYCEFIWLCAGLFWLTTHGWICSHQSFAVPVLSVAYHSGEKFHFFIILSPDRLYVGLWLRGCTWEVYWMKFEIASLWPPQMICRKKCCFNHSAVHQVELFFGKWLSVIKIILLLKTVANTIKQQKIFICLTLLVGWQEGHPVCKKDLVLVCWW